MAAEPTIVVLGAGINGAAIARELTLSGVGVIVVDGDDVVSGTTAWSTRLIHGGLRYLEYGEIGLVRESLVERNRLVRLAPHLVRPLPF
ncbi:MAG: FAD-dependent oxidoreductase, partial [Planctomycetia bacterium]